MNLRDLHYFVAVARLKHFRKASEECCVSQPTLSAQIKKLEHTLGVDLFVRNNRNVSLTEVGEQILLSAKQILEEEANIKELATSAKNPFLSTLKIGAFPTLAPYFIPKVIASLKEEYPKLNLAIIEEKSEVLLEMLGNRQLDFAFLALPIEEKKLSTEFLFDDSFYLAVHKTHPLANEKSVDVQQLKKEKMLLLQEGHCLRDQVLSLCDVFNGESAMDYKASSLETLRQMVLANSGITLMPKIAISNHEPSIKYVPFNSNHMKRKIGLVHRHNPTKAIFIEFFKRIGLGRVDNSF